MRSITYQYASLIMLFILYMFEAMFWFWWIYSLASAEMLLLRDLLCYTYWYDYDDTHHDSFIEITTEVWTKWLAFADDTFKMHFHQRKILNCD